MDKVGYFKIMVNFYQSMWYHNPKYRILLVRQQHNYFKKLHALTEQLS